MQYEGVLFDLGGTLFEHLPTKITNDNLLHVLARSGLATADASHAQAVYRQCRGASEHVRLKAPFFLHKEVVVEAFADTLNALGLEQDPDAVEAEGEVQVIESEPQPPAPTDGRSILNRGRAEKLMKEAIAALEADDVQLARVRAMQAKQLNVAWRLWEKKPEDILAAIDQTQGTTTFLAGDRKAQAAATRANSRMINSLSM